MSVRWLIFSFVVVLHFSLAAVEDRKDWLRAFKAGTHADYNVESVTYESFINKELILFSVGTPYRTVCAVPYVPYHCPWLQHV